MAQVMGEIDRRHAAPAELALDAVAVPKRGLEPHRDVGEHGNPGRSCVQWYSAGPTEARSRRLHGGPVIGTLISFLRSAVSRAMPSPVPPAPPTYIATRRLFLRLLGAVYFVAFASLA